MVGFTKGRRISNVVVDADLDLSAYDLKTDDILESTDNTGVTIDGVELKDSEPYCDVINEKTTDTGVTIDGVKLKDSEPYCDVINEKTADTGVTVDSTLLKDGNVEGSGLHTCTIQTAVKGTPVEGDMNWDSTAHKMRVYNGTAWETVTSA